MMPIEMSGKSDGNRTIDDHVELPQAWKGCEPLSNGIAAGGRRFDGRCIGAKATRELDPAELDRVPALVAASGRPSKARSA